MGKEFMVARYPVGAGTAASDKLDVKVTAATLEIHQTGTRFPTPILLATFRFAAKTPVSDDASDAEVPWSLKWRAGSGIGFLGTADLDMDKAVKVESWERVRSDKHFVRTLGGREHEAKHPQAASVRGGYLFARASAQDGALRAIGRLHPDNVLMAVNLSLDGCKTRYLVPFLYESDGREDWIYDEHTFRLSFTLKVGERQWSASGPELTSPAHPFLRDASKSSAILAKDIGTEYGNPHATPPLRPRRYSNCLDAQSPVVDAFRTHLVAAAAFINDRIPDDEAFTVTPLELGSCMLTEGAVVVLWRALAAHTKPEKLRFHGYEDLGIDSYATRWTANEGNLRLFTQDILQPYLTDPRRRNLRTVGDEQSHRYATFRRLNLEESVFAVAGMYAFFKERLARALADEAVMGPWVADLEDLPLHVQHYWATFYFNTSSGHDRGTGQMRQRSVEMHDVPWEHEDEYERYKLVGRYNACWRTATFRLLENLVALEADD